MSSTAKAPPTGRRSSLRVSRCGTFCALLVLPLFQAGCGSQEKLLKTVPVKGKVTYQGKPVAHGSVIFTPLDMNLPGAVGRLGPDGGYELTTYQEKDGAPIGEYKVAIRAFDEPTTVSDTSSEPLKPLVPEKYLSLETSPLRETVQNQNVNEINFDL